MTYDVHLADRIRALLGDEVGVTERRMFGGLAFLVSGNMAVAANSKGALMVRTGADRFDELLDEPGTSMVVMRNRPMTGWLDVDADHLLATARLRFWIEVGVAFARRLPAVWLRRLVVTVGSALTVIYFYKTYL